MFIVGFEPTLHSSYTIPFLTSRHVASTPSKEPLTKPGSVRVGLAIGSVDTRRVTFSNSSRHSSKRRYAANAGRTLGAGVIPRR